MQTTYATSTHKKTSHTTLYNVVWFISIAFALMLFGTALSKLLEPDIFYNTIHQVKFIRPFASFLMYAVPYTELIICVLLLFNERTFFNKKIPTRKIGLIAGGALMLAFTIYIVSMLLMYGKNLPCSCGGLVSYLSWQAHIVFNLAVVGLTVWALLLNKRLSK